MMQFKNDDWKPIDKMKRVMINGQALPINKALTIEVNEQNPLTSNEPMCNSSIWM